MGRIVGGATGLSSGLIRNNAVCKSYQRFATEGTSTWHKPANANWVYFEIIGGGGGGGGGSTSDNAGGGGGGAFFPQRFPAEAVPNSLTVVVGAEADEGTGGVYGGNAATHGDAGNFSSVSDGTFTLKGHGGGAGRGMVSGNGPASGAGGGGTGGDGATGSNSSGSPINTAGGRGGYPTVYNLLSSAGNGNDTGGGMGGGGGWAHHGTAESHQHAGSSEYGGGGGGEGRQHGGSSIHGAGGGCGVAWTNVAGSPNGGEGGSWGQYANGGGGEPNDSPTGTIVRGGTGASRVYGCGDGGGSGLRNSVTGTDPGNMGGHGGDPGGGGAAGEYGRGGASGNEGGTGGRGEVRITTW